jgi:6-phosphogluconolactonase
VSVRWFQAPDAAQAAEACAHHVIAVIEERLAGQEYMSLAVSGGSTPKPLFEQLAHSKISWDRVHLFWVDERCVPPTDDASNFKMTEEKLIRPASIPQQNVHRIYGEMPPSAAAARYSDELREFFGLGEGEFPHFDLVHLGLGPDAHIASLFPGDPLIDDRENLVAATYVEQFAQGRVTLLPGPLLAAKHTVFLLAGADKRDAVRAVFHEEYNPLRYPAQIVSHHGRGVTWFLDEAAAGSPTSLGADRP